jgi:hypothetical protein
LWRDLGNLEERTKERRGKESKHRQSPQDREIEKQYEAGDGINRN